MRPVVLALLSVVLLSACGFSPVYGTRGSNVSGVEDALSLVSINRIPDREGQYLRNALIDRMHPNGSPVNARYSLKIAAVTEQLVDLDITKDSDSTRAQLRLNTAMVLNDLQTGELVLSRRLSAVTSTNILSSEFSTRVSEDNARLNALSELARQAEQHLSLYFRQNDL